MLQAPHTFLFCYIFVCGLACNIHVNYIILSLKGETPSFTPLNSLVEGESNTGGSVEILYCLDERNVQIYNEIKGLKCGSDENISLVIINLNWQVCLYKREKR